MLRGQKAGYWSDIENRKRFLLQFAEETGFDPKVRANWKGKTPKLQTNEVTYCCKIISE